MPSGRHASPVIPTEFFRTPRLAFRPFMQSDLDALAAIIGDPRVARFVGDGQPLERPAAALWITRSRENVQQHGYGTGAVVELTDGRLVGWAGWARPEGEPEELVYGFAHDAWGRGYATEIAAGLVRFARESLELTELRAITYEDNAASRRVLERLGFQPQSVEDGDVIYRLVLE
ncbi:GNAT family N-acetyltransferase [Caulobacter sp. 73W]|uniref:GNAT family N-acetyltransferase n=1 Tax=Caulobacter sp. 73W TaxID=3161137 RepID=A0AB39KUZ0_9CAUL